jgi:hypothetical protein
MLRAASIELRFCDCPDCCGDPLFVLFDDDGEVICSIGLTRESMLDLITDVQRVIGGVHGVYGLVN